MMTIGTSKERLIELNDLTPTGTEYLMGKKAMLEELISHECKELNPWQPIDESTPKDRELLLFYSGNESSEAFCWIKKYDPSVGVRQPTHWQELPEDPKND